MNLHFVLSTTAFHIIYTVIFHCSDKFDYQKSVNFFSTNLKFSCRILEQVNKIL